MIPSAWNRYPHEKQSVVFMKAVKSMQVSLWREILLLNKEVLFDFTTLLNFLRLSASQEIQFMIIKDSYSENLYVLTNIVEANFCWSHHNKIEIMQIAILSFPGKKKKGSFWLCVVFSSFQALSNVIITLFEFE